MHFFHDFSIHFISMWFCSVWDPWNMWWGRAWRDHTGRPGELLLWPTECHPKNIQFPLPPKISPTISVKTLVISTSSSFPFPAFFQVFPAFAMSWPPWPWLFPSVFVPPNARSAGPRSCRWTASAPRSCRTQRSWSRRGGPSCRRRRSLQGPRGCS